MTNPRRSRYSIPAVWRAFTSAPLALTVLLASSIIAPQLARAQTYTVLYAFKGAPDGDSPVAALTLDKKGNLYGTTLNGGSSRPCGGCGTVFKLSTRGNEIVLHSFSGYDGESPGGGVVLDDLGNLYGTAYEGGSYGAGTAFKLNSSRKATILHSFTGPPEDGAFPFLASLARDTAGNLYGVTSYGGSNSSGIIFQVTKTGREIVLYNLGGAAGLPFAGLARDHDGNLYGTSFEGGDSEAGSVFELTRAGKLIVLHTFSGGADGGEPESVLVSDKAGNLYGTTVGGGNLNCSGSAFAGCGVVFKLNPRGKYTVLHAFTGTDGIAPRAGVVLDKSGNLYGTTSEGGIYDHGTLFEVSAGKAPSKVTVLHYFAGGLDGADPEGGVIWDGHGNLFGTTIAGGNVTCVTASGNGCGTVFKFTPLAGQKKGRRQ